MISIKFAINQYKRNMSITRALLTFIVHFQIARNNEIFSLNLDANKAN